MMKLFVVLLLALVACRVEGDDGDGDGGDGDGGGGDGGGGDGDGDGDGDGGGGGDSNSACPTTLTAADIKLILKIHNEKRQALASGDVSFGGLGRATDMLVIEWSEDLASKSQERVNLGKFEHGGTNEGGKWVGQSIATSFPNPFNLRLAISSLYDKEATAFQNAAPQIVTEFSTANLLAFGHLSQMVWAKTSQVGCAVGPQIPSKSTDYCLIFCDYYPAGNYAGDSVYMTDGDCPSGTQRGGDSKYPDLCAKSSSDQSQGE